MSKNFFTRTKAVLLETAEELIFGFDYAHPERAKPQNYHQEQVKEKTDIERAIAERKQQVWTIRTNEKPSREKGRDR